MTSRTKKVVISLAGIVTVSALIVCFVEVQARWENERIAQVYLERGIQLYHQKAYLAAEGELRRALRADPAEWKAPFYVGAVEIALQRFGLAVPYLERALSWNPTEPKILNALGVVNFKLGRLDMAKGYFWASLELDPSNGDTQGLMEAMAKLQRRAAQGATSKQEG